MANIYRKVNADLISTTQKDVYTVPGNTRALIKSIHIYNEGAGDAVVTIKINSNSVDYFYGKKTIAADAVEDFVTNVLILHENDELRLESDITGPDVVISLLEINREDK